MSRKPWEVPITYNDDRFEPAEPGEAYEKIDESRSAGDVEALLRRHGLAKPSGNIGESNDTSPINDNKGPHDEAFGIDEDEFDVPDNAPEPYDNLPHDEEFGVDDDETYDDGFGTDG